jgi:hypothetical protein
VTADTQALAKKLALETLDPTDRCSSVFLRVEHIYLSFRQKFFQHTIAIQR